MADDATPADEPTAPVDDTPAASANTDEIEVPPGAENPDAVKAALTRERTAAKEAKARASELEARLKEYEDRDKSDQEKLAERATAAESAAAEATRSLLRLQVATSKGLGPEIAQFLTGETEDEMAAQADQLLALAKPAPVTYDGGPRDTSEPQGPPEESHNAFLLKVLGRQ